MFPPTTSAKPSLRPLRFKGTVRLMNRRLFIPHALGAFALLLSFIHVPASSAQQRAMDAEAAVTSTEADLVREINLARTRPADYATFLEGMRPFYDGKVFRQPGIYEAGRAVNQLLRHTPPLMPRPAFMMARCPSWDRDRISVCCRLRPRPISSCRCDQSSIRALPPMRVDSHSPAGEAGRPIKIQASQPMCKSGQTVLRLLADGTRRNLSHLSA